MREIAVIGAGQLGSRHLQSLASLHSKARLHMVDPSEASLDQARSRVREAAGAEVAAALQGHAGVRTLPRRLDAAVVATTSDRRFEALVALLGHASVPNLLLEKVLFQKFAEYRQASDLFERHGTRAWVNCPRRTFDIYHTVKSWFVDDTLLHMEVAGGDWGLGCNGIHFVDLFAYLTGSSPQSYERGELDAGVSAARRAGFVEFSGTLRTGIGAQKLALTALRGAPVRHLVTLRSARQQVVIDEGAGTAWRYQGPAETEQVRFSIPYQSQITASAVTQMMEQRESGLTRYAESAALHLPFLTALADHVDGATRDGCAIT